MTGRLGIDDVTPCVSGGRQAAKAVVGEVVPITAVVWREGHDAVAANVVWRRISGGDAGNRTGAHHVRMEPVGLGGDTFATTVVADEPGMWTFRVDAWSDPWATWRHAVTKKLDAGQSTDELANDLEIGARLLQRVGRRPAERVIELGMVEGRRARRQVGTAEYHTLQALAAAVALRRLGQVGHRVARSAGSLRGRQAALG